MKTLFSREFKFVKAEENMNPKLRRKRTFFSQIIILLQGLYTGLKETDNPSNKYQRSYCSKKQFKNSLLAASCSLVTKQYKKYRLIFFTLFIFNHQDLLFKANGFLKCFKQSSSLYQNELLCHIKNFLYIHVCSVPSYIKVHNK